MFIKHRQKPLVLFVLQVQNKAIDSRIPSSQHDRQAERNNSISLQLSQVLLKHLAGLDSGWLYVTSCASKEKHDPGHNEIKGEISTGWSDQLVIDIENPLLDIIRAFEYNCMLY